MHVKYKLRKAEGLINPKGPNFSRAQTIYSEFDGTVLSFKAPKHRSYFTNVEGYIPERHYHQNEIPRYFKSFGDNHQETPNHLKYYHCFQRFWTFYGPWFTGTLAQLKMHITLIMPANYDHEFSLFHPRAFEKIVGDYLTDLYGDNMGSDGTYHYTTPVNWQPITQLPVVAARLDVTPNKWAIKHYTSHHLFFTLSDQIMASVRFEPSRIFNRPKEELDKEVSVDTMLELMNQIIGSFQLTLSDKAQAQQKAALAGLDDTSLVKSYPPLDWGNVAVEQKNKLK